MIEKREKILKLIREAEEELQVSPNDRQEGELSFAEFREEYGLGRHKARKVLTLLIKQEKVVRRRGRVNNSSGYWYKFIV